MIHNTFAVYDQLLDQYWQAAGTDQRDAAEQEIWARFGAERAVFVLDMSGFSRLTREFGVVHYLSMVRRMHRSLEQQLQDHHGHLVKFEADNCFATFDSVVAAVRCALSAHRQFAEMNLTTSDAFDIHVCVGIAAGKFLMIEDRDFFGDAVNRAARLGEDVAEPGEILVDAEHTEELASIPHELITRDAGKGALQALRIRW